MMSWLEEEIGIPPEPKQPKAVETAMQKAGGMQTTPGRKRESAWEAQGLGSDPLCQDQSKAPLSWQGGAHSRISVCICAECLPWLWSKVPASLADLMSYSFHIQWYREPLYSSLIDHLPLVSSHTPHPRHGHDKPDSAWLPYVLKWRRC